MTAAARWFSLVLVTLLLVAGEGRGAAPGVAPGAVARPAPELLRVMSFNVRLSQANDGENGWAKRAGIFFATIRAFGPDVIGFQEVLADQFAQIREQLPEYVFGGVGREDGKDAGERVLLGYRRERFAEVERGDFWLSEQPAVPGSQSWDAALPRLCSWVRLRARAGGGEWVFANTHFDHRGVVARREAARVVTRELARIARGAPMVLTGDLNTTEDDPAYATLVHPAAAGALAWRDAYREVYPQRAPDERSFHAFEGGVAGARIDFILHTDQFVAVEAGIDRTAGADGRFPSDHYPVTAVLRAR